jgi:hypothetical protein
LSLLSSRSVLVSASRTRRTASALWRCAGQAMTDNDPGRNTMVWAIAQAAVVVLPRWRAVSASTEAPAGARKKVSCHGSGVRARTSRTHGTGSIL